MKDKGARKRPLILHPSSFILSYDWRQLHGEETAVRGVVDPRRRLRIALAGLLVLLAVILGRAVQLEVGQGAAFRAVAVQPIQHPTRLPGPRGRILARDGAVLACDIQSPAVAVHYRYLQEPPDAGWLRQTARAGLTKTQRNDPRQVAAQERQIRLRRLDSARRVAELCGLPAAQWDARSRRIQARVERMIAAAERRRPGARGPLAEELDYHVMVDDVSAAVAAEIENRSGQYPGVKIVRRLRRTYPAGTLAAHVLGYLGEKGDCPHLPERPEGCFAQMGIVPFFPLVGLSGVERQYESLLRGHPGTAVELTDHSGHVLGTQRQEEPRAGRDLVLTLDPRLQHAAEELLAAALERRAIQPESAAPAGGAIAVMDLRDGAVLAAASAPGFDPGVFLSGDDAARQALLHRPDSPLLDRVVQMALPPGSVFKTLTAVALLESATVDPQQVFTCRGYLHDPGQMRCEIYIRQGIGHGPVTLADALARSCNVYFFHYAGRMGPAPLEDWARRLGFGRPTGVDLPGEAAGTLPTPQTIRRLEGHGWRTADTQRMAVGQGSLTATPLQVLRLMAAVATGKLLTPHVASRGLSQFSSDENGTVPLGGIAIAGLHPATLSAVREGLLRVVADPKGTAYGSVRLDAVAIAGKTGTASAGEGRRDHAWFAGYVPAEAPKLAFVIVLEHAGDGAVAAGPVAKRLVLRMQELGMF
ncbi:MAG: peptidoglycan D,D-transpeptidase FtsI family protein [Thermoguttaceae bacterium]